MVIALSLPHGVVERIGVLQWLPSAFGLVVVLSATLGVGEFGINTAFNDFCKFFIFVSVALYLAS